MKVKGKLMAALGSLKDQAMIGRATISGGESILSGIDVAVIRATDHEESPADDKYIHEILFLVSNSPGSITFLARRLSSRLLTARHPGVALKTLLLLHRLIRGGDRYFEQDLRNLCLSGDLRMDLSWIDQLMEMDPLSCFVVKYSLFLSERMGWIINQAGRLEPAPPPCSGVQPYEEKAVELLLHRISKCQAFLDRAMEMGMSHCGHAADQVAMSIVLRESFRVYDSFCEGMETVISSLKGIKKNARVLALDILKKACTQTPCLYEFYEGCKRSIVGKRMDYPFVLVITSDYVASMEDLAVSCSRVSVGGDAIDDPFSRQLETKISTVWVEFEDEGEQSGTMGRTKEML